MTRHGFATSYARYFGFRPQGDDESDVAFHERVVGDLRRGGHIIEAHEVNAGQQYDDGGELPLMGIGGAVAAALSDRRVDSDGYRQVGEEIAMGSVAQDRRPKMSPDMAVAAVALLDALRK